MKPNSETVGPNGRAIGRAILIIVGAAAVLWFTLAITAARLFPERAPQIAFGWGLRDARSEATYAARVIGDGRVAAQRAEARRIAEGALRRDASVVAASRTLAIVTDMAKEPDKARRLFRYSEALSRRDVPTELWLIEDYVRRDDVSGALKHYDRALRVSNSSRDLLLPILVKASADPNVAKPLETFLRVRPPWWRDFYPRLMADGTSADTVALLAASLRLNPALDSDSILLQQAMAKLVSLGAFDRAYALYRSVKPGGDDRAAIRNGDFEQDGGLAPFDWVYVDEVGFGSFRQFREDGQNVALFFSNSDGRRGQVARQLLLLAPGRYHLTGRVGGTVGEEVARPSIALLCADSKRSELGSLRLPAAAPGRGTSFEGEFQVPSDGCAGQWLTVLTGGGSDNPGNEPWIDSLAIRPVAG